MQTTSRCATEIYSIYSADHHCTSDHKNIVICQVLQSFCLVLGYFFKLLFEDKIDFSSLFFNGHIITKSYLIPLIESIYIIPCIGLNGTFGALMERFRKFYLLYSACSSAEGIKHKAKFGVFGKMAGLGAAAITGNKSTGRVSSECQILDTNTVVADALDIASQALKNPLNLLSLGWDYFNPREITEAEKITVKFCESKIPYEKFTGILHLLANCLFFLWILWKANILTEDWFSCAMQLSLFFIFFGWYHGIF
jgi:hypothetical protein